MMSQCPAGYVGVGPKGCTPQLTGLSVSCGVDAATHEVALTESDYEYSVKVPVTCRNVTLMAAIPVEAQLEIQDVTVDPESAWRSAQLHIGSNRVKLVVTSAESRRSSSSCFSANLPRLRGKSWRSFALPRRAPSIYSAGPPR